MNNNKVGLTTLAYKCNISSHIIHRYLYNLYLLIIAIFT